MEFNKRGIIRSKKADAGQVELAIAALLFTIIASTLVVAINISLNSSNPEIPIPQQTEKSVFIEIWADTYTDILSGNRSAIALLRLDNGTAIPEQEIEFYINNTLINKILTNEQGLAIIPLEQGIYILNATFLGNPELFLNPSSIEKQIDVSDFLVTNQTIQTNITNTTQELLTIFTDKQTYIYNETINIFGQLIIENEIPNHILLVFHFNGTQILSENTSVINGSYTSSLVANFEQQGEYFITAFANNLSAQTSFHFILAQNETLIDLGNLTCKQVKEHLLWTTSYTQSDKGSTKYQVWNIDKKCKELGANNCFLENITLYARALYSSYVDLTFPGYGYIQISDADENACLNPEQATYKKYLVYDTLNSESYKFEKHYGNYKINNEINTKTKSEIQNYGNASCYAIKGYSSQYFIIDVFDVEYTLCSDSFENSQLTPTKSYPLENTNRGGCCS